ncbi:MAG: phosphoesterase [Aliarcobacter sp.]|uniref:Oligoribonuclease NrnB n=1 Tax=Arcobacter aquimarinus TaxID=1315211 RepID=A0AAE7B0R5_9BACT|nr:phosphoesterase [Arcobacter aquimarinus]MCB9096353.1 phosphoesterase [Arcobacter sp.]QKE25199.1 oligoribonuclease NrnB [Arcobacter aquimarinus]RXI36353.1 phosphoesterase [Arcobacter aquimarinus]
MKLFHISHTDLDGFTCQLITKEFFKEGYFYNANYGLEVKLSIKKALEDMLEFKDEEILFLITDLNLTFQESKDLDLDISKMNENGYKIKLQLLDHHVSGKKSADSFYWYYLDDKRCATKIVYDYMFEEYEGFDCNTSAWLKPLVDAVNAVDIWLEHEKKNFEFGKVLMSMVTKVKEINNILFADLSREFKFYLLKEASKYLDEVDGHIKLDNEVHFIKKEFLKLNNKDDTLDNLSAIYLVKTLDDIKEQLTVTYQEHKGLLTYCLGSISIPANAFLKANPDYDFFIDINKKGSASFRADGKLDVSILAAKLANGGGHVNASGGKFEDFKETINFSDVKNYIQNKLNKI